MYMNQHSLREFLGWYVSIVWPIGQTFINWGQKSSGWFALVLAPRTLPFFCNDSMAISMMAGSHLTHRAGESGGVECCVGWWPRFCLSDHPGILWEFQPFSLCLEFQGKCFQAGNEKKTLGTAGRCVPHTMKQEKWGSIVILQYPKVQEHRITPTLSSS